MSLPQVARTLGRRAAGLLVLAAVAAMAVAPTAFGLSSGMHSEASGFPADFDERGCTSCHGGAEHLFAAGPDQVEVQILDEEGNAVTSGAYVADATYTINITLHDELNPEAANSAGFYLTASAGTLEALPDTNVQITGAGSEASHTDASATAWTVEWVAPHEGAVLFQVLVNDADGDGAPSEGDQVYRKFFALTDEHGAQLGAAEGEEHAEFGVSLQQYWIGLLGLAGMVFIILATLVYLRWMNPAHADQKDR